VSLFYAHRRVLPSFPTRRSSDLLAVVSLAAQAQSALQCLVGVVAEARGQALLTRLDGQEHRLVDIPQRVPEQLAAPVPVDRCPRSEEHTSELQSRFDLVCRLLLE